MDEVLTRIAIALERIADSIEKPQLNALLTELTSAIPNADSPPPASKGPEPQWLDGYRLHMLRL